MSDFISIFSLQWKQFCSKRNLVIWLILLALTLLYTHNGIRDYRTESEKEDKFKKIQSTYFQTTRNYDGYGRDGIKSLFVPAPTAALFKNTIIPPDLFAKVDSIVLVALYNNLKGKSLSPGNIGYIPDFSVLSLFILSLLAMFYGYQTIRNRGLLKMLVSCTGRPKQLFALLVLGKFSVFTLAYLLLVSAQVLLLKILGVALTADDYLGLCFFGLSALLMFLFFFLSSALIGSFKIKGFSATGLFIALWLGFIIIIPGAVHSLMEDTLPDATADYQAELDKFGIVADFEKRITEQAGDFDRSNIESERKFIEEFWSVDFAKMESLETELKSALSRGIDKYGKLALLTPTTFYLMTCNEVSSCGYENFLSFYDFTQALKRRFTRFWINRVFYNNPRVMVNFIKGDENIYRARSRGPALFKFGVLINLFWCILLFVVGNRRIGTCLFDIGKTDVADLGNFNLKLSMGSLKAIYVTGNQLRKLLFCLLSSGQRQVKALGFAGSVCVDNQDVAKTAPGNGFPKRFLYICPPDDVPGDITVSSFLEAMGRAQGHKSEAIAKLMLTPAIRPIAHLTFDKLSTVEKFEALLALTFLDRCSVYLIEDIAANLPLHYAIKLKEQMDRLTGQGSLIIYLTSRLEYIERPEIDACFADGTPWIYLVEEKKRVIQVSTQIQKENE